MFFRFFCVGVFYYLLFSCWLCLFYCSVDVCLFLFGVWFVYYVYAFAMVYLCLLFVVGFVYLDVFYGYWLFDCLLLVAYYWFDWIWVVWWCFLMVVWWVTLLSSDVVVYCELVWYVCLRLLFIVCFLRFALGWVVGYDLCLCLCFAFTLLVVDFGNCICCLMVSLLLCDDCCLWLFSAFWILRLGVGLLVVLDWQVIFCLGLLLFTFVG